jgi:3-oxoacyl-[acyl-carrier protein] reductase
MRIDRMKLTFNQRIAVVTGAGRGIGKAIARSLAAEGVKVICVSLSESSCQKAAEEIRAEGGDAIHKAVDVASSEAVQRACAELLAEYGTIDILINNAGITRDGLLLRMSDDDWNAVIQTNLTSAFYWIKALAHPMARKRWGRIVNITSVIGLMGNAGQANYAAAKAGMLGLTMSVAREFASRNITANAVAPGFITTDMTAELGEAVIGNILKNIPLKRMGTPEEIASTVTFLCSEEAGYTTGQCFTVDGGMVM